MSRIGTGFLYGRYYQKINNEDKYHMFLITNKHVMYGKNNIWVRFNPQGDEPCKDYNLNLINQDGSFLWTGHPDKSIDVAVVGINPQFQNTGILFGYVSPVMKT